MTNYFLTLVFIVSGIYTNAQNVKNDSIIVIENLEEDAFYSIQNNGWALTSYENAISLANFSNKEYVLHFPINCKTTNQKPRFLIEYSNNYGDTYWGGIDFASSNTQEYKILFFVDGAAFANPFEKYNKEKFTLFIDALKKGAILTIHFLDEIRDESGGGYDYSLNREIEFKLANSQLLDEPVDCE